MPGPSTHLMLGCDGAIARPVAVQTAEDELQQWNEARRRFLKVKDNGGANDKLPAAVVLQFLTAGKLELGPGCAAAISEMAHCI